MPQHLQQSAPPAIRPAASPVVVSTATRVSKPASKWVALTDAEYAEWYRMKRGGLWRWVLVDSVGEFWVEAAIQAILVTFVATLPVAVEETWSWRQVCVWSAGCFTIFFQSGLWFGAALRWYLRRKRVKVLRIALQEDAAP